MRHRGQGTGSNKTVLKNVTGTFARFTDLLSEEESATGKHKLPTDQPVIPVQKVPTHDTVEGPDAEPDTGPDTDVETEVEAEVDAETGELQVATEAAEDVEDVEMAPQVSAIWPTSSTIPARAHWKAGHGARTVAAAMLLLAVAGTSALGLRYAQTRSADEFLSVVVGVAVVVGLWALLIASTPQVVSLRGSILTVRNSLGSERFDLADGLQPVDVVGEPRSSGWAVLLHRDNNTSVVLRRRDVDAATLDPIVRHYRALAEQRYSDRQVRFTR
jgi:hypothetical protein